MPRETAPLKVVTLSSGGGFHVENRSKRMRAEAVRGGVAAMQVKGPGTVDSGCGCSRRQWGRFET